MKNTRSHPLTIALVLALLPGAPALAAGDGRIAYVAEGPGTPQLYTIAPDGSGKTQITHLAKGQEVAHADWSLDGMKLTYEEFVGEEHVGIFIAAADGTGAHDLTSKGFQGQPSFSPDGRSIVFEREAGGNGLAIMDADGSHVRRLTRNPFGTGDECGCDTDPNFSPDGTTITFLRIKRDDVLSALFAMDADGTHLRRLTPYKWDLATKHAWAPDGSRIVLSVDANEGSANIDTIRPDGTGLKRLTHFKNGNGAFVGSYSPDGTRIAYRIERGGTYTLATMAADGSDVRTVFRSAKIRPRYIDWGMGS